MEEFGADLRPREVFAERFALLYTEAGDPPLRQVTTAVGRTASTDESGRPVRVTVQRVSDWRRGRNVPARFAALAAVLKVLIGQARKTRPHPCLEGLYDLGTWHRLWEKALASPVVPAEDQLSTNAEPDPGETDVCPYKGLAAFNEEDAKWFFGRQRSTATLLARLRDALDAGGIVMLVGASGAGKSSLINAGLVPGLAQGELTAGSGNWPVVIMTPGVDPLDEFVRHVPELTETLDTAQYATTARAAEIGTDPTETDETGQEEDAVDGLGSIPASQFASRARIACAAHVEHAEPNARDNIRLIIIVDQFEEAFTLCGSEERRRLFVQALDAASTPETQGGIAPAMVVVGVRADFYSRCLDYPELATALQDRQMVLGPMTTEELREAVTSPAEAIGLQLEAGLVELMLRDLGVSSGPGIGKRTYDAGALPLLSHAVLSTWQRREGGQLTVAGYRAAGGIQGAVAETAERAWAELDAAGQAAARAVLLRLVRLGDDTKDTRRRAAPEDVLEQVGNRAAAQQALEVLARARLVILDARSVQITHEALLEVWPRLRQWIDTDRAGNLTRQELEDAAAVWDRDGRDSAGLYRGSRLEVARTWASSQPGGADLSPAASAFLAASTQQERRITRLNRAVLVVLSVLALVASGTAIVAFQQNATARRERDTAIFNQITAEADRLRATDVSLAAQLDLTAYRMRPTPNLATLLVTAENAALSTLLTEHADYSVASVVFSPDGRTLATGDSDGTVRLWNVTNPTQPTSLPGHTKSVTSVAFSSDGHTLATGSEDKTVRLWNVTNPVQPNPLGPPLTGHTGKVTSVAFSSDGHTLATGSEDKTVRLWNVADPIHPTPIDLPLKDHIGKVISVAFSPDGHTLATGSGDQTVRLWNMTDPTQPTPLGPPLTGHTNWIDAVAFSPDGHTLATGSADRTVRLWNVTDPAHRTLLGPPLTGHTSSVTAVAFSPDGHTLATGSADRTVRLWSIPNTLLTGHTSDVAAVAFSPDGHTLATGSGDQTVRLWNVTDPAHPTLLGPPLTGHTYWIDGVAFSPDGHTLAIGSADRTARLWDMTDPAHPTLLGPSLTGHTNWIDAVAFSPDGRTLVTSSEDQTVRLWNVTDPTHPTPLGLPLTGHNSSVTSVAFSPDGRTLATGSGDQTVRLWNVTNPAHPTPLDSPLTGHTGAVFAVAFSPDGRTLATGSGDQTVRLWNVTDPAHPAPALVPLLTGHTGIVWAVAFSPDGRTLATGSADQTVRLWGTNVDQAIEWICATTTNTLTPAKWEQYVSKDLPYRPPCP